MPLSSLSYIIGVNRDSKSGFGSDTLEHLYLAVIRNVAKLRNSVIDEYPQC